MALRWYHSNHTRSFEVTLVWRLFSQPALVAGAQEESLDLVHGILGRGHCMPDRARVVVDLVIPTALLRLVAKEVQGRELVVGEELQAECLVPAVRAHVDAYLSTDREHEVVLGPRAESLGQLPHDPLPKPGLLLHRVEHCALLPRQVRVPADGADVDGALALLNEVAALVDAQARVEEPQEAVRLGPLRVEDLGDAQPEALPPAVADVVGDAPAVDLLRAAEGVDPVLAEAEVELLPHLRPPQLDLLPVEVASTDDAHNVVTAQLLEELDHLIVRSLGGDSQRPVNVEQDDGAPVATGVLLRAG
mmetsp:Transcript_79374/g.224692  ORF Transcript_79374/g.224692 Transcript_79374/m.224692 type:complete len:305 (-) Transcript_79374:62-976(-)